MNYSSHDEFVFRGNLNDLWFGARCVNLVPRASGGQDISKWSVVRMGDDPLTQLSALSEVSPNSTNQLKVLGVSANTMVNASTDSTSFGFVVFGGYIANMPVYGTVLVDSFLKMSDSGGLPGYAEAYSTIGQGRIFAKAKTANASGHGTVKALLFPWRL
jgi:hypothetical protein